MNVWKQFEGPQTRILRGYYEQNSNAHDQYIVDLYVKRGTESRSDNRMYPSVNK